MSPELLMWALFGVVVAVMLVVDLAVFHRKAHAVHLREAAVWSAVWIVLALLFNVGVTVVLGPAKGAKFLTGFLIEKSLSVDNLFVFLVIFRYFRVPAEYQHTVLFWGIIGALAFRGAFIGAGVTIVQSLHWTMYVLGAFLVVSGVRLGVEKGKEIHPERNLMLRVFRRGFRITPSFEGARFFVRKESAWWATPLFVALIVVETTDIAFATDSIPAILGITTDPFIVYTSNIFAILGLRALYFVLAGVMDMFRFLHYGLSVILVFVGAKMLLAGVVELHVLAELLIVVGILAVSIALSMLLPKRGEREA